MPTILFGYPHGIQLSIVLTVILSGWGGWAIGSELGLRVDDRVRRRSEPQLPPVVTAPTVVTPSAVPERTGTTIAPADVEDWGD